jgi:hypothetical protein
VRSPRCFLHGKRKRPESPGSHSWAPGLSGIPPHSLRVGAFALDLTEPDTHVGPYSQEYRPIPSGLALPPLMVGTSGG